MPNPQFQYAAPYPYTSYIDPQAVPFSPVSYMPYYPVQVAPDPYRGKSKVWVPKHSKAIPITDPNVVQPKATESSNSNNNLSPVAVDTSTS